MIHIDESRGIFVKILTIVGFFATIALVVWLFVQGLRFLPGSFASLASIADSVQNYQFGKELTIDIEKDIVNSGEPFTVKWDGVSNTGTYYFTPTCKEHVTVQVLESTGSAQDVICGSSFPFPNEARELTVTLNATEERFTEVPFTIAFESNNKKIHLAESSMITVIGKSSSTIAESDTEETAVKPETVPEVVVPEEDTTPAVTPSVPTYKPAPAPVVTTQTITYYPTSDKNGYTDLRVQFVGVGVMRANTFVPTSRYEEDERGAFRFEVKNIGTKTSDDWHFSAELPGNVDYSSKEQEPLLPNERAVFTLGFDVLDDNKTKIIIDVETDHDSKNSNNELSWTVQIDD